MIRALLITALLALPLGVAAQATAERPERGNVTAIDAESGYLEGNGIGYSVPVGGGDLGKAVIGGWVTVQFKRVGNTKLVTDLEIEDHVD